MLRGARRANRRSDGHIDYEAASATTDTQCKDTAHSQKESDAAVAEEMAEKGAAADITGTVEISSSSADAAASAAAARGDLHRVIVTRHFSLDASGPTLPNGKFLVGKSETLGDILFRVRKKLRWPSGAGKSDDQGRQQPETAIFWYIGRAQNALAPSRQLLVSEVFQQFGEEYQTSSGAKNRAIHLSFAVENTFGSDLSPDSVVGPMAASPSEPAESMSLQQVPDNLADFDRWLDTIARGANGVTIILQAALPQEYTRS